MWPSWQIEAAEKYAAPVCLTPFAASAFGAKMQVRPEQGGGGEKKAGRAVIIFILAPGHIKLIIKKKKKEVIFKYLVREPAVQMRGAVPAAGTWRGPGPGTGQGLLLQRLCRWAKKHQKRAYWALAGGFTPAAV